jgi:uncharacterized membrane protein
MNVIRWLIVIAAVLGIMVASAALREHYNTGVSPCSINDRWDCGIVNKSPYAMIAGVPVAAIGIGGYLLIGVLAWRRAWWLLFPSALAGLGFSLYLTHVEASILQVWCVYCVTSQGMIALITILSLIALFTGRKKENGLARSASN